MRQVGEGTAQRRCQGRRSRILTFGSSYITDIDEGSAAVPFPPAGNAEGRKARACLAPHTGAEARERPSEHQTSVFSAIPCNQLITTWIPDPQPATEPFSHLRLTQGGP